MRALPLLACLAACGATPQRQDDAPGTHAMYTGNRRPPLAKMAVLLVLSPPDGGGRTFVGRVRNDETGEDFRPPLDLRLVELAPGHYRIETYFWATRSHLRDGNLVIENLQSAEIAPMDLVAEEGRTYFVGADVRRSGSVPPEEKSGFFDLFYGATVSDPGELRDRGSRSLTPSEFVWRPRVVPLSPSQAKEYRSHR